MMHCRQSACCKRKQVKRARSLAFVCGHNQCTHIRGANTIWWHVVQFSPQRTVDDLVALRVCIPCKLLLPKTVQACCALYSAAQEWDTPLSYTYRPRYT